MPSRIKKSPPDLAKMRSEFEKRIAKLLHSEGIRYEYEAYQFEYIEPLRKNKARCSACGSTDLVRSGWYTPDFWIPGHKVFIETKGRFTAADRRKMLAVKEGNPEESFLLLFQRDQKIHKGSDTKYSDWCKTNGFDYAVGEPKQEWFK